jgi:hypothetical protein
MRRIAWWEARSPRSGVGRGGAGWTTMSPRLRTTRRPRRGVRGYYSAGRLTSGVEGAWRWSVRPAFMAGLARRAKSRSAT